MIKKINISIVGTGLMGVQHIKAISKSKKAKLHSIVDISNIATNLSKKYKIPLYSSVNELLNSKNYLASLKNKKTNIQLDFYSNLPGVQLYTSQCLRYKNKLAPYQGVCLETQQFPDAPNNKNFPSTLIKVNKLYKYFTKINIS